MKKLIVLLIALLLLAASAAIAEDTDFDYVPDEELMARGSYQSIQRTIMPGMDED